MQIDGFDVGIRRAKKLAVAMTGQGPLVRRGEGQTVG